MRTPLFLLLTCLISSCTDRTASVEVNTQEAPTTYEYDSYEPSPWTGPGLYWGVYINNEDDYWRYHNQYHNHNNGQPQHNQGGYQGGGHHGGGGGHH